MINGLMGTFTYAEEGILSPGHPAVVTSAAFKVNQGILPTGLLLARSTTGLVPYAETADHVLGAGGAAATEVSNEVIGAGDGTAKVFQGVLAHGNIEPGSVSMSVTVGAAPVAIASDASGRLSGTGILGHVDHAAGYWFLSLGTAADNATNLTASYAHTAPARSFTGTMPNAPIERGSVSVSDGVESFSDQGDGRLAGSAGGYGSYEEESGHIEVTFAVAPLPDADVLASARNRVCAVLESKVDTSKDTSGNVVKHGAVRCGGLKVGTTSPSTPSEEVQRKLEEIGIYAV